MDSSRGTNNGQEKMDISKMQGKLILIEINNDKDVSDILGSFKGNTLIYSPVEVKAMAVRDQDKAIIECLSIRRAKAIMMELAKNEGELDFHVINRIDMMDIDVDKRERGSRIIACLSRMTSEKNLRGACLVVVSGKSEYRIREMADKLLDLKI
jgi:hypothetical protein